MNKTPMSNRTHIVFLGKRNAGKSSLINLIANQEVSIVSAEAGTTTDPVYKSMEILPLGPCVLVDTAGLDDSGQVGQKRVEKAIQASKKTDIALIAAGDDNIEDEIRLCKEFIGKKIPVLVVATKADLGGAEQRVKAFEEEFGGERWLKCVAVSTQDKEARAVIIEALGVLASLLDEDKPIIDIKLSDNALVLLVMPQDIQAPKGRLILPQVQTIRELLDKKAVVVSTCLDTLEAALNSLKEAPELIITDSQALKEVNNIKPKHSRLTSFSILLSRAKGDGEYFEQSARALDALNENSRVLIAEACTHAPLTEDIGRVKIPRLLRKRLGEGLEIDIVSGSDFPSEEKIREYDLIIHCGGCMFNRRFMLSRVELAKQNNVPMTNYGTLIAYANGVDLSEEE